MIFPDFQDFYSAFFLRDVVEFIIEISKIQ